MDGSATGGATPSCAIPGAHGCSHTLRALAIAKKLWHLPSRDPDRIARLAQTADLGPDLEGCQKSVEHVASRAC